MSKRCPIWKDGKQCVLYWRGPGHEGPHQYDREPTQLEAVAAERDALRAEVERLTMGQEGLADAYLAEQKRADEHAAELSSLRSHYDRAAPEHDLLALLDLYQARESESNAQLAAMRAARDTACEIAEAATFVIDNHLCPRCRSGVDNIPVEYVDDLRKVGTQ